MRWLLCTKRDANRVHIVRNPCIDVSFIVEWLESCLHNFVTYIFHNVECILHMMIRRVWPPNLLRSMMTYFKMMIYIYFKTIFSDTYLDLWYLFLFFFSFKNRKLVGTVYRTILPPGPVIFIHQHIILVIHRPYIYSPWKAGFGPSE